ncbi:unnamed protein product, partial [Ceratitis capitata]
KAIALPDLEYINHLSLGDPKYYQPKTTDIIVGADMIAQIMLPEIAIAQNTSFGVDIV